MYHFENETFFFFFFFNLQILERKKLGLFEKSLGSSMPLVQRIVFIKWLKGPKPLVQTLFIWNFFFSWKYLEILIFFKKKILKYIHKQSASNATWIFRIQRNMETWNKKTNFKLNHDVTNLMWSEIKLGCLLLLGPFRMLETWYA